MLASKRIEVKIHQWSRLRKSLSEVLKEQGRCEWLDVGSSENTPEFIAMNIPEAIIQPEEANTRLILADILDIEAISKIAKKFDLVRMQHVFEHFSPEEAPRVLTNVGHLLKPGGVFIVTVPDLAIHARAYLQHYRYGNWYQKYAEDRLKRPSSSADVFSMFAHLHGYTNPPVPGEAHKWCYDTKSFRYLLTQSGLFSKIKRLSLLNALSEIPFTHNRPYEDLCFLAERA